MYIVHACFRQWRVADLETRLHGYGRCDSSVEEAVDLACPIRGRTLQHGCELILPAQVASGSQLSSWSVGAAHLLEEVVAVCWRMECLFDAELGLVEVDARHVAGLCARRIEKVRHACKYALIAACVKGMAGPP